MTEKIDRDRAVELLTNVVEAKGRDYVYEAPVTPGRRSKSCVYFDGDGCPSCVVGHVFAELGVNAGAVHEQGRVWGSAADEGNRVGISGVDVEGVEMTGAARAVLQAAQRAQDGGLPWGEALNLALVRAEELRKSEEN